MLNSIILDEFVMISYQNAIHVLQTKQKLTKKNNNKCRWNASSTENKNKVYSNRNYTKDPTSSLYIEIHCNINWRWLWPKQKAVG